MKKFVYWMATKRRNWRVASVVVVYWLVATAAVLITIANRGLHARSPWVIGVGAFGLMLIVDIVLVGLSLHWGFALIQDRHEDDSP